jgi:hypothetical protein
MTTAPAAAATLISGIPAGAAIGALRRNRSLMAFQP